MRKILYVDACVRPNSRTRILAEHLLTYLDGEVTHLDLFKEKIFPLTSEDIKDRRECLKNGNCDAKGLK